MKFGKRKTDLSKVALRNLWRAAERGAQRAIKDYLKKTELQPLPMLSNYPKREEILKLKMMMLMH